MDADNHGSRSETEFRLGDKDIDGDVEPTGSVRGAVDMKRIENRFWHAMKEIYEVLELGLAIHRGGVADSILAGQQRPDVSQVFVSN